MQAAFDGQDSYGARKPLRQRLTGLALAVVVNLLFLAMMLTLAPELRPWKQDPELKTFNVPPEPKLESTPVPKPKEKEASGGAAPKSPLPPQRLAVPKPKDTPPTPPLPFVILTKEELASADIGKMPARGDTAGASTGKGAVYGPGEGPGGQQMYNADWYRRPTNAELDTYMPANRQTGWGLVACKTIENYHVENCQVLGESPLGSGFGKAVRLAAWQFLVKPPRIDGKPQIGAIVRIRIDYIQGVVQ